MRNQQRTETCEVLFRLYGRTGVLLALGMLLTVRSAVGQSSKSLLSERVYTNARLAFRYTPPNGMHDKTGRFQAIQIENPSRASGTPQTLATLLAMSSGPDRTVPDWRSITIVSYPRNAVSDADDSKAAGQMNARVAHNQDTSALPKPAVYFGPELHGVRF